MELRKSRLQTHFFRVKPCKMESRSGFRMISIGKSPANRARRRVARRESLVYNAATLRGDER